MIEAAIAAARRRTILRCGRGLLGAADRSHGRPSTPTIAVRACWRCDCARPRSPGDERALLVGPLSRRTRHGPARETRDAAPDRRRGLPWSSPTRLRDPLVRGAGARERLARVTWSRPISTRPTTRLAGLTCLADETGRRLSQVGQRDGSERSGAMLSGDLAESERLSEAGTRDREHVRPARGARRLRRAAHGDPPAAGSPR